MKTNSVIGSTINTDGTEIKFTVKGAGEFTFDLTKVSEACRVRAMVHGFVQRISDGAALSRDQTTGLPATPEAKLARMQQIADHYMSGTVDWAMRSAGGGGRKFDVGAVVMGLIEAGLASDVDAANGLIAGLATKRAIEREAAAKLWAATAKVGEAMARIAARNAPAGADDLMAEIAGEATGE